MTQWGSQKFKDRCLTNLQFTFPIFTTFFWLNEQVILSKAPESSNFESHNSLKLSFSNICEVFVRILSDLNLSLNQTLLTFMLCVRQTWMAQVIVVTSWWGLSCGNLKKLRCSYAWSCSLCEEYGLPFARDFCQENSQDTYLYFWLALFHSLSCLFFLYRSPSCLSTVFDALLSNID